MPRARVAPAEKTPKVATPAVHVPRRINEPTLDDHLEIITRAIFQAGLSWAMIAARWDSFSDAFAHFACARVAAFEPADVEGLMTAPGIVHSRKKIEGTIKNARTLLALQADYGSVTAYIERFATYREIVADVRKRFAFVGDLSCYYWLFRTGHRVPRFEDWIVTQSSDHPRMREMVLAGRAEGTSTETAGLS